MEEWCRKRWGIREVRVGRVGRVGVLMAGVVRARVVMAGLVRMVEVVMAEAAKVREGWAVGRAEAATARWSGPWRWWRW